MIKCPICSSTNVTIEKRPDGDTKCLSCGYKFKRFAISPSLHDDDYTFERIILATPIISNDDYYGGSGGGAGSSRSWDSSPSPSIDTYSSSDSGSFSD